MQSLRAILAILEIVGGVAIAFGTIALANTVVGALLGLGAAITFITTGFWELTKAFTESPGRLVREMRLEEFRQNLERINQQIVSQANQLETSGFSIGSFNEALKQFSNQVNSLNKEFVQNYTDYSRQFGAAAQRFIENLDRAAQAGAQVISRLIQYVEPLFRPLIELGQLASDFVRFFAPIIPGMAYAPILPGGAQPPFRVGALEIALGGLPPALGVLISQIPLQMQAALIARMLQQLQVLPPEILAGLPQGEIQRLWQELLSNIQRNFQTASQAISENLELLATRLAYFDTRIRLAVVQGANAIAAAMWNLREALATAASSAFEVGMSFSMLERIIAAYPGIERTVAFQRLYNEVLRQTIQLYEELAARFLRFFEILRRIAGVVGETLSEMAAWGYELVRVWSGLQELVSGRILEGLRGLAEAGFAQLRPTAENLIYSIQAAWFTMLVTIRQETARALQQLLTGNVEGFLDSLRTVTQRILQLPEEYINRFQQLSAIALRPLNYMLDILNGIRSTLGMVGAEMALFPFILSRAIPPLIEMRNQWQAVAAQAAQVGDVLTFTEALRNVNELQRRIMELLGVTGIFLPAYTPEQMMRMFIRIGMPGLQEIREVLRGGLLGAEPAMFRAVPIPLAQFFGLPAPAFLRLTPDIFGGFPFLWAGLQALTPWNVAAGFRMAQLQGLFSMLLPTLQMQALREAAQAAFAAGYQTVWRFLPVFQMAFGLTQQELVANLMRQLGGALPPWLLGNFVPQAVPLLGRFGMLGLSSLAMHFGFAAPQAEAVLAPSVSAIRELSFAVSSLRDAFRTFSLRLRAEPIVVEIPVNVVVTDAQTGEILQRLSRSLQIRLLSQQPM